jgi:hypothetical protein
MNFNRLVRGEYLDVIHADNAIEDGAPEKQ